MATVIDRLLRRPDAAGREALEAEADALVEAGEYTAALRKLRAAARGQAPRAAICYQMARCQMGLGRLSQARRSLARATRLNPDFAAAFCLLGDVLLQTSGARAAAEKAYLRAIVLAPEQEEAYRSLASLYRARQEPERAAQCLRRGIRHVKNPASLLVLLGDALHHAGSHREARRAYQRAWMADPQVHQGLSAPPPLPSSKLEVPSLLAEAPPDALHAAVAGFLQGSNLDEVHALVAPAVSAASARPDFEQRLAEALGVPPDDTSVPGLVLAFAAASEAARLSYSRRETEVAVEHYEAALGALLRLAGAMPQAAHVAAELPSGHFNLGLALLEDERVVEALPHLLAACRLQENLAVAVPMPGLRATLARYLCRLGEAYKRTRNYEESLASYRRCLESLESGNGPEVANLRAWSCSEIGIAYFRMGSVTAALEHHRTAAAWLDGLSDPVLQLQLGQVCCALGSLLHEQKQVEPALQYLGLARALLAPLCGGPHSPQADVDLIATLHNMGAAAFDRGDPDGCRRHLDEALNLAQPLAAAHPEDPHCQDILAVVNRARRRYLGKAGFTIS